MKYLSLHIAGTGASVGKSDAAVQSMEPTSPSNERGVSSNHGSSAEPASTDVGSRSASQTGSGNGTGSGSGSGSAKGSAGSGSGNGSGNGSGSGSGNGSAGSDGYCG